MGLGSDFGIMAHVSVPSSNVDSMEQTLKEVFPGFVSGVSYHNEGAMDSEHVN